MPSKPEKPLRLFVNPLAIWTGFAFKTVEAMLASVHAASARADAPRVAVRTKAGGKAKRRAKR